MSDLLSKDQGEFAEGTRFLESTARRHRQRKEMCKVNQDFRNSGRLGFWPDSCGRYTLRRSRCKGACQGPLPN